MFASLFSHPDAADAAKGGAFYALVNRHEHTASDAQLAVPADGSLRFFDLFAGAELVPTRRSAEAAVLNVAVEPRGFGGVLATSAGPESDGALAALLARMATLTRRPLSSYSAAWAPLPQVAQANPRTAGHLRPDAEASAAPEGMVLVPRVVDYTFRSTGLIIEPEATHEGMRSAVDVQFAWEATPRREHEQVRHVPADP